MVNPTATPQCPPADFAEILRRALSLHQSGQLAEAERLYAAVLAAEPDNFDALHLCGVLKHQRGEHAQALGLIAQALKSNARSAPAHSNYGNVLAILDRHEDAVASFDKALALAPDYAEALFNRGNTLIQLGRDDSPWYPTARLFRQSAIGDWDVIARLAAELAATAKTQ
jgi:tetratricopeptide (TPR) repeat protein